MLIANKQMLNGAEAY